MAANKHTSPTVYSAAYTVQAITPHVPLFLRIADDDTNRIMSWSNDGQHWIVSHTVGRTDFLTADEVGFMVNSNNATWPASMTLLSWVEA